MDHANGLSRGDRNRNSRLTRLRELVPPTNAIVAIDLAGEKQMLVVTDHDSRVLARRTFRLAAWHMSTALDWAGCGNRSSLICWSVPDSGPGEHHLAWRGR